MTKGAGKLKRQGSAGISSDQQESAVISRALWSQKEGLGEWEMRIKVNKVLMRE